MPTVFYVFLILLLVLGLLAAFFPERFCAWTARYWADCARMYGFEAEIRSTPKAIKFCRIWNLCFSVFVSLFLFIIILNSK